MDLKHARARADIVRDMLKLVQTVSYEQEAMVVLDDRVTELEKCRAENKELNAIFDLQHTRTQKAEHLWQKATGNLNTMPDLGTLLEWLMGGEIKEDKE